MATPRVYTENGKTIQYHASCAGFIDYADAFASADHNNRVSVSSWYADNGYEDALRLARNGWPEGRRSVEAITERLNITGRVARPDIVFDVIGEGGFDIGLALAGIPECAMDWRDSDQMVANSNGPIVRMVVDISTSAGIGANVIKRRGAALLALVDALEAAGRRVEIEAVYFCSRRNYQITIMLKAAGDALQIDQIAFALAHPAFLRRFCHMADPRSNAYPAIQKSDADIYLGPMALYHGGAAFWNSEESSGAWIRNQLGQFGVALEGAL